MPSFGLRHVCPAFLGLVAITGATGCSTMGGSVANSSGMGYYEQGNYMAAATEFQQAVQRRPNNPDYLANLAKTRVKLGDAHGGEQMFRQALTVDPSHQPSYHGLAELMLDQGRDQEAAAMMTTWAATQPYVAESHVELAWLQREMGMPDAAAESLQNALDVNPSHATALAHLGQYYEEAGQPQQAVAMYQQSLRADWNQPEVHSRVAAVSQSAGEASPMAATAMARGVHPYNVPRQATAFGPPSRGAQMAQWQMMQQQMAMAGQPMMNPAMAGAWNQQQFAMSPMMTTGVMPPGTSGWQAADPAMMASPQQQSFTSFGTTGSMNIPADATWSTVPESNAMPATAAPSSGMATQPTPDPRFSATPGTTPATSVSWSASSPASPTSTEAPVVDAF